MLPLIAGVSNGGNPSFILDKSDANWQTVLRNNALATYAYLLIFILLQVKHFGSRKEVNLNTSRRTC